MSADNSRTRSPLFSVIIPTHGRPVALQRAVDSVLAQTHTDHEVIVVDDGGTPAAPPFDDPRVRVLRLEVNRGVSAARNHGIEAARGQWVTFLDDDDVWYPRRLEAIANEISDSDAGRHTIFTTDLDINDHGYIIGTYAEERPFQDENQLLESIRLPFLTVMFAVRADFLAEVGGFDEQLRGAEDGDLLSRLMLAGGEVRLIPEALGCYNRGEGRTRDHEVTWSGKLLWLHKLSRRPELTDAEAMALDAALEETRHRLLRVRAGLALESEEPHRAFLAAAATVPDTRLRRRGWLLCRSVLPDRWFQRLAARYGADA